MKFLHLSMLLLLSTHCAGMERQISEANKKIYQSKVFISQTPYCLFLEVALNKTLKRFRKIPQEFAIEELHIRGDIFNLTLKNASRKISLQGPLRPNFETAISFSLDGHEYTASAIPQLRSR